MVKKEVRLSLPLFILGIVAAVVITGIGVSFVYAENQNVLQDLTYDTGMQDDPFYFGEDLVGEAGRRGAVEYDCWTADGSILHGACGKFTRSAEARRCRNGSGTCHHPRERPATR